MTDFELAMYYQFSEVQKRQQYLTMSFFADKAVIVGKYCLFAIFEGEEYLRSFEIEVIVSHDFPNIPPIIKETSGKINRKIFPHVYSDGSLCLEVKTKIILELRKNPTLCFYFEHFVDSYFLSYIYFMKHGRMPFGERSHNDKGTLEFYKELFGVNSINIAREFLIILCERNLKGHNPCPCLSGNRYRNCHHDKISALKNSGEFYLFQNDYKTITSGK